MRHPRLLLPLLVALTTAACSGQKPAYYVTDAATGQRVATGRQDTSGGQRGLLSSGTSRTSGAYAYAATQGGADGGGRGLFNSDVFGSGLFGRRSSAPVYNVQPRPPQTYSYQPPAQPAHSYPPPQQQAYVQPSSTMQYHPPQPAPQAYAQQPYPQPRAAGYHAERYRWY